MLTKSKWAVFTLLMLCGGSIYKLSNIKDAFYVPMQQYLHLTNGEIGNAMSINSIIVTIGYFIAVIYADKMPRRFTIGISFIGTGLLGLWLSTMPSYWIILLIWALFGVTNDMFNWPLLLKSVSSLGNSTQQGRLFGFFETGRGVFDTIIAFAALGVFTYLGSDLFGFKSAILFFSAVVIIIGILVMLVLKDEKAPPILQIENPLQSKPVKKDSHMRVVLKNKFVWLVAFNIFFVYAVYCGLTYFIPMLKDVFMMPVALVGAYGIINQYCLKMVGGPIGGLISDKILKSPTRYLLITFTVVTVYLIVLIFTINSAMNIFLIMGVTLIFGAIIFTQRSIFFAPMGEINIDEEYKGSAMGLASFIGYAPAMFCFSIYGHIIDKYQGLLGYKIVFCIMTIFAIIGIILSAYLLSAIKKNTAIEQ